MTQEPLSANFQGTHRGVNRNYRNLLGLVYTFWFTKECHVKSQKKAGITVVISIIAKHTYECCVRSYVCMLKNMFLRAVRRDWSPAVVKNRFSVRQDMFIKVSVFM